MNKAFGIAKYNRVNQLMPGLKWRYLLVGIVNLLGMMPMAYSQYFNFDCSHLFESNRIENFSGLYASPEAKLLVSKDAELFEFDGNNIEILISEEMIPFANYQDIQYDDFGNFYFLSNQSLFKYLKNGELIELPITMELLSYASLNDHLMLGSIDGLYKYDLDLNMVDAPNSFRRLSGIKVNKILLADNGWVFIASEEGLWKFIPGEHELELIRGSDSFDIENLYADSRNRIWGINEEGFVFYYHLLDDLFKVESFRNYKFNSISEDQNFRIWCSSENLGFMVFDSESEKWVAVNQENGLPNNSLISCVSDIWKGIWILTNKGELCRYLPGNFQFFGMDEGLRSSRIIDIAEDGEDLWCINGRSNIAIYNRGKWMPFQSPFTSINSRYRCLAIDGKTVWIGTENAGIIKWEEDEFFVFDDENGLPGNEVDEIVADKNGTVWASIHEKGLVKLSPTDSATYNIESYNLKNGLADLKITALSEIGDRIYFGTANGYIQYYQTGQIFNIAKPDTLLSSIQSIDSSGNFIYFSSRDDGIWKLNFASKKNSSVEFLDGTENTRELIDVLIRDYEIYLIKDKGVYIFPLSSEAVSGEFTLSHGFPLNKVNDNASLIFNHAMWISADNGLVRIDEINESPDIYKPFIKFKEIFRNYDVLPYDESLEVLPLRFNENRIGFAFTGIDLYSNNKLEYSFILEGQDKEWSPWTNSSSQNFNNLKTGNYVFKVKARTAHGFESDPIKFDFEVRGPIWNAWWFYPGLIIIAFTMIYLVVKQRIRSIRTKNKEEKDQLELKNRLLELEQKANQLQMNPHFIFNALNAIQTTVAKENYELARKEINDFAQLMRSILGNSKQRVIPLMDELSLLRKYVSIEKKCRNLDFDFEITIADRLDEESLLIPPMIIQPFIENAIIHGLSHSENGKLQLRFIDFQEGLIKVEIEDNGVGFETSQAKASKKSHKSMAVSVTTERLNALIPKIEHPAVQIKQIEPDKGGTIVKLKIPVEYVY